MSRHKRWAAKARKAEDRAIRRGAPAAICKQCGTLRRIREPVYDGPLAVTHGRCWICGRFTVQPDFAAHWRRVFTYCGPEEPKHWLDRCSARLLESTLPPAERLVSTDFDMLVFDVETGEVIREP